MDTDSQLARETRIAIDLLYAAIDMEAKRLHIKIDRQGRNTHKRLVALEAAARNDTALLPVRRSDAGLEL